MAIYNTISSDKVSNNKHSCNENFLGLSTCPSVFNLENQCRRPPNDSALRSAGSAFNWFVNSSSKMPPSISKLSVVGQKLRLRANPSNKQVRLIFSKKKALTAESTKVGFQFDPVLYMQTGFEKKRDREGESKQKEEKTG